MKRVPQHIREIYGSSHRFRSNKRKLIRRIEKLMSEFRRGAAYFPNGAIGCHLIDKQVAILKEELSTRNWGK